MLQAHLQAYYAYGSEPQNVQEDETSCELGFHSNTALETFLALFANHDEFCDEIAAKKFLVTAKSADQNFILNMFADWVHELRANIKAEVNLVQRTANTAEELGNMINPFVKSIPRGTDDEHMSCCPWPIVKIVK